MKRIAVGCTRDRGFTLVEMMLTIAMIGLVISILYTFYLGSLLNFQRSTNYLEHQQSARIALDKMLRELRYANMIQIADNNREIRFKIHGENRTLRFRRSGSDLIFDSYPTGSINYFHTKVALGINDLQFSLKDDGTVAITVCFGEGAESFRLSGAVLPKNIP